jgi:H+/Cl- antiporter ClcA
LTGPVLAWALLAGPACGVIGVGFVRLTGTARIHAATGGRAVVATVCVFTALGVLAIPYPELLGNGKGPAQLALAGAMSLLLAAVLTVLKPVATAGCLAAGAIGGLLTPALATGATFGFSTGSLWNDLWPGTPLADFAVVAAAAVLAVTQRAPLTAMVLVVEFVRGGLSLAVPMLTAVGLAVLTAWVMSREMTPIALARVRERMAAASGSSG